MPKDLVAADGAVAWSAAHSAYGRVVATYTDDVARARHGTSVSSPFRMLGQVADQDADLCWTRFRCFDPETGTWISTDPLEMDGGLNLYGLDGAPTVVVDPLGLTPHPENDEGKSPSDGLKRAEAARDAKLQEIAGLSSKKRNEVSTVVGVHDPATGNVAVGVKRSGSDHGKCAEDLAREALPGNPDPKTLEFTEVVRPRTGEVVPRCDRCVGTFGPEK